MSATLDGDFDGDKRGKLIHKLNNKKSDIKIISSKGQSNYHNLHGLYSNLKRFTLLVQPCVLAIRDTGKARTPYFANKSAEITTCSKYSK